MQKTTRRQALRMLAALGAAPGVAVPRLARAQTPVPATVRAIVPLTPGTTPDLIARAISPAMTAKLQTGYYVENRAGASGMIGMGFVAKNPDPALLLAVPSTTTTLPLFYKSVGFDVLHTFTPITQAASSSFVLVVNKSVPVTDLQQFVAWAKSDRRVYASPGNGTHHHLFMEMLKQNLGIDIEHVPYSGSASAFNDVLSGQVPTMFMPIQVAVPHQESGRIKIIGGSLKERHPGFPNIPSLAELGAKGYDADPWFSFWGAPHMPADLVERYRQAIIAGLSDPQVKSSLTAQGLILKWGTPAELQAKTEAEQAQWTKVVRTSGIDPL